MATKKIGSAGRFGSRYGRKIRKNVSDIEVVQRASHTCGYCEKTSVKRKSFGVWECRSCGRKTAGAAYRPRSPQMKAVEQAIARGEQRV